MFRNLFTHVSNGGKRIVAVTEYPQYDVACVIYEDETREEMPLSVWQCLELL